MKLNYIKTLFVAILTIFATTVNAETYSGSCGTNLKWNLDTETWLLKITGTGEMSSKPWSSYNSSIKSVEIGEGVTSIGSFAFYYCEGLTSVTIPNSVTSIGNYAFSGCEGLTGVYITDLAAWCNIEFPSFVSNPLYYAKKLYLEGSLVTELEIPEGVTAIKDYAFSNCEGLTSVTIGNGVTSIGNYAFSGCSGLTGVYITDLAAWCNIEFEGYDSNPLYCAKKLYLEGSLVRKLEIPEGVTAIKDYAFSKLNTIRSVTIPNSVTSIGDSAFYNCSSLTSVTIPNSVTSIGSNAFSNCEGLTGVYITDLTSWCNIEFADYYSNPLYYAHKLYLNNELVTDLVIPEDVTTIKDYAFNECTSITSVTIPNSVTSIGEYAFFYCPGLTSIAIPNSVTSIESWAFSHCSGLTSVTIGNSVTSIGIYAFYYCPGLTSITIPNSVTSIGSFAFYECSGLTSVTIPNSVTSIGESAFYKCSGLTGVYITDLAAWCNIEFKNSSSNPLFNAKKLYLNNEIVTDLEIPEGITAIKDCAFSGCSGLTSVTIGNGVTSIGNYAFQTCTSLTSVTIPNSVTSIGESAFRYCSRLTSVTIGSGVSEIGEEAFYKCNLKSIYSLAEYPPLIYTSTFKNVVKTIPVYIPKGTKEDYEFEWSDFTNFIESDFTGVEENKLSASVVKAIAGNGIEVAEYYGKLRIVNLAGQVVRDLYINGSAQIELPKGTYIIVTDNNSQKVVL